MPDLVGGPRWLTAPEGYKLRRETLTGETPPFQVSYYKDHGEIVAVVELEGASYFGTGVSCIDAHDCLVKDQLDLSQGGGGDLMVQQQRG